MSFERYMFSYIVLTVCIVGNIATWQCQLIPDEVSRLSCTLSIYSYQLLVYSGPSYVITKSVPDGESHAWLHFVEQKAQENLRMLMYMTIFSETEKKISHMLGRGTHRYLNRPPPPLPPPLRQGVPAPTPGYAHPPEGLLLQSGRQ